MSVLVAKLDLESPSKIWVSYPCPPHLDKKVDRKIMIIVHRILYRFKIFKQFNDMISLSSI